MTRIDIDELIKIIVTQAGLSKQEIEERMQQKQADLKGLIKEDAALILVAKDLGVDVSSINQASSAPQAGDILHIKISDIRPGMQNLTLVGKILKIFPVKEFNRKSDGQPGKVGSFILKDETGDIRFVLWNNHAQILEDHRIEEGDVIRALNVIAKANQNGAPELTLAFQGRLELNPDGITIPDVPAENLPFTKIADISLSMRTLNCAGVIVQKFEPRDFSRNGKSGQVGSLILQDETGVTRVTFWTENIDTFNHLEVGDQIEVLGIYPKQSYFSQGQIDLNLRSDSIVNIKGKQQVAINNLMKIADITENAYTIDAQGIVGEVQGYKDITRKDGSQVSLFSFVLIDETGAIRVTAWDDKAEELREISKGQTIEIKGAKVRKNANFNQFELSLSKTSSIVIGDQIDLENLKNLGSNLQNPQSFFPSKKEYSRKGIVELNANEFVTLKGAIVKNFDRVFFYEACPKCRKKIENCSCGQVETPIPRMIVNATFDDGTDTIRLTFFGDLAEQILGEKVGNLIIFANTPEFDEKLNEISKKVVGKEILVFGRVRTSDFSIDNETVSRTELSVDTFNFIDSSGEAYRLLGELA